MACAGERLHVGAVPSRRWSIPLEGELRRGELFVGGSGRIIASTTRSVEERAPGGLWHIEAFPGDPVRNRFHNQRAHRCYAIDPDGAVAWSAAGVHAKAEGPDGSLIATGDRREYVVLDRDGVERERWAMGAERWAVGGWSGAGPIVTAVEGAAWVEPHIHALFDRHLHRLDAAGKLLERIAIPRAPFDAERARQVLADWYGPFLFPWRFELAYDASRSRLIASHWYHLSWVMSLQLDGTIDWLTLVDTACCNRACAAGGVTVHTSACGAQISFLSADGAVFRTHRAECPDEPFRAGEGTVCVVTRDALRAFDLGGEPAWTIDLPGIRTATARNGRLYAAAGEEGRLELTAFDLG